MEAVALAAIGLAGTMVAGLFKLLNDNTKALTRVAEATEKGAEEAATRNGHLGDVAAKTLKIATKTLERLEKTAIIAAEDRDVLVRGKK